MVCVEELEDKKNCLKTLNLIFPDPLSKKRALKTPLEKTPVNINLYRSFVLQEGFASGPTKIRIH